MPEPTLATPHIKRCAAALQSGFSTVNRFRAANIMLELAADRDRLREENEHLKSLLPSSPEAAAEGGGFDPYNP